MNSLHKCPSSLSLSAQMSLPIGTLCERARAFVHLCATCAAFVHPFVQ